MYKRAWKIKNIIELIFLIVFSMNSFAAVVSDNDGAAFISKAEFDTLSNQFQSQIDTFNTSIDDKIDNAIATYLSDLVTTTRNNVLVINNSWDTVYFMNQEIKPEFHLPEFVWMVGGGLISTYNASDKKFAAYTGFKKYTITWGANETNYRPTVGIMYGNEATPGKLYWDGVAIRWKEQMYIGKYLNGQTGNMYGYPYYRSYIINPFSFSAEGYVKTIAANTFIQAEPKLQASSDNATWINANADNFAPVGQAPIGVEGQQAWYRFFINEDEKDGETKCYEHVIINKANTSYWVSNRNWTYSIYKNADNPNTDATLGGSAAVETHIHGQGNIFLSALNYKTLVFDTMNFSYVNVKLPSLGMLTSKKEASTIYQKKYQVDSLGNIINNDISWNNVTVRNAPAVTLKDGYELCVGKDENKYTYNIEFDSIECYNGAVKETDKNEIDIYLSYVPFSDSITTSEPVMLDNSTGTGTINHITTTGRKAKLQWTAKKSKVIYMKCKPHWSGTEYMDKDFTIVFNTKKNNIVEVESIGK